MAPMLRDIFRQRRLAHGHRPRQGREGHSHRADLPAAGPGRPWTTPSSSACWRGSISRRPDHRASRTRRRGPRARDYVLAQFDKIGLKPRSRDSARYTFRYWRVHGSRYCRLTSFLPLPSFAHGRCAAGRVPLHAPRRLERQIAQGAATVETWCPDFEVFAPIRFAAAHSTPEVAGVVYARTGRLPVAVCFFRGACSSSARDHLPAQSGRGSARVGARERHAVFAPVRAEVLPTGVQRSLR